MARLLLKHVLSGQITCANEQYIWSQFGRQGRRSPSERELWLVFFSTSRHMSMITLWWARQCIGEECDGVEFKAPVETAARLW